MRSKIIFAGAIIFLFLCLTGCGSGGFSLDILGSPAEDNGVIVTLNKAQARLENDPSRYVYTLKGTIENISDEPIMRVTYSFAFYDEDGEEFHSFALTYDEEEQAIKPHEKVTFSRDDIVWGAQDVPESVRISVGEVKTEAELPAVSLPHAGDYLYKALGDEKLANIKQEPPVKMTFHVDQGGYGRTATFEESSALDEAVKLFSEIKIKGDAEEWVTDNYNYVQFTWADGTSSYISLNQYNLEYSAHSNIHVYNLSNLEPFWDHASSGLVEDA